MYKFFFIIIMLGGLCIVKSRRKTIYLFFALFLLITGSVFAWLYLRKKPQRSSISYISSNEQSEKTETNHSFHDYTVYESENLSFRFVIAHITINDTDSSALSLHDIVTSEGIHLDEVDSYISQMEENDYYVGKKNVWLSIPEKQKSFDGNLFFPIVDSSLETVELQIQKETYAIDLTKNEGNIQELVYQHGKDTISDQNTYQLRVTDLFEITGDTMYQENEELMLPSSARIYALKLQAMSLNTDFVVIESAELEMDDGTTINAENGNVYSMKYENMIGKQVQEQEEGCLFFILMDPGHSLEDMSGKLKVNLQGIENPVEIPVSLKGE